MPAPTVNPPGKSRSGLRLVARLVLLAGLAAAIWLTLSVGNPLPTNTLVMATGPEGSAYELLGTRYQALLRRSGVELRLVSTAGGFANIAQLQDRASGVSVAFVESGVTTRQESPELVSLGGVGFEPLWLFSRGVVDGTIAERFTGRRIAIEPEGSGARVLARRLLALNGVPESTVELLDLPPPEAARALMNGEIDMAFLLAAWESPAVRALLVAPDVALEGFPRADAYVALYPVLSKFILPQGTADLARNLPPADVPMIGVEANLLVRRDLHPALQYLLLQAAAEIHGGPDVFHQAGRFPAPGSIDLPLSDQAQVFYRSGRPFVYRYLPFWAAALTERLLIILIPLIAIVFPLVNIVPRIFQYLTERRIFTFYRELRRIEQLLESPTPAVSDDALATALGDLDHRATRLRVPLSFTQRLFILKSHIALARQQVEARRTRAATHSGPPESPG